MIHRAFRYRLHPTAEQADTLAQFAGVCRLTYNLALEQRRDHWRAFRAATGKGISYPAQARELTDLRRAFDWIAAVHVTPLQQALRDLDAAYQRFFKGLGGYPSPRRRGVDDGFRYAGREIETRKLNGNWSAVRLPKIGWVRFRDTRPRRGKLLNLTVRRCADGWRVCFACEIAHEAPANDRPAVGIDRGVAKTLALSNGEFYSTPLSLLTVDRKTRRAQRTLSRRKRGSNRYAAQRQRVARLKARAARIRRDWAHRTSLDIARRFGTVALEDLNTKAMTASAKGTIEAPGRNVRQKAGLNRAILNQGWRAFETLLAYKLEERGGVLCKVSAHHTSQTCAECGAVDRESRESQASFHCRTCGHCAHADTNAARNILRRNTAPMDVEEGHWFSCEASTGRRGDILLPPENPPPSGGGGC